MDFKIFADELFIIFPTAGLAQTLDLYSALRLNGVSTADPVAVARDDVVIREHMTNGRKMQAIKELRYKTGLGLLDSKNAVEAAYSHS